MRAKFIGDPNDRGSGPAVLESWGVSFPKGEFVPVEPAVFAKAAKHSHFDVDGEGGPFDHDGDGRAGGSLSKAAITARLTELGVDHDARAKRDDLAKLLADTEAAAAAATVDE